jgi:LysM repeat protein
MSPRRANEKHGRETPEPNFSLLTSGTEALPNSIGKWARAMSRFLQHRQKKLVGAGNQSQSAGGRTKVVVALVLIVSGSLFVERVDQSVQLRGGLAAAAPIPNEIKDAKPPSTIDTIKTFYDASKEVSERPHRTPDDSTVITLESGQTLSWLSLRYLGRFNDKVTQQIQTLNPEIKNPDLIFAGTQLRLPVSPDVSEGNALLSGGVSIIEERSR